MYTSRRDGDLEALWVSRKPYNVGGYAEKRDRLCIAQSSRIHGVFGQSTLPLRCATVRTRPSGEPLNRLRPFRCGSMADTDRRWRCTAATRATSTGRRRHTDPPLATTVLGRRSSSMGMLWWPIPTPRHAYRPWESARWVGMRLYLVYSLRRTLRPAGMSCSL